jgi:hypothetical protein
VPSGGSSPERKKNLALLKQGWDNMGESDKRDFLARI